MKNPLKPTKKPAMSIRLALLMNGIILITLLILGLTITKDATDITQEIAKENLDKVTDMAVDMVDTAVYSSTRNYLRGIAEKNTEIVQSIYDLYLSGQMSESEAKSFAETILLSQSIGETGYIYCLNSDGLVKVHPLLDYDTDVTDFAFVQEQMALKSGYIEYDWKNPGESTERPKALYMDYFQPWDWIISVSSYRNEFHELTDYEALRENILDIKFWEDGYIGILDQEGVAIIHPFQEGNNLIDAVDNDGNYFLREMIEDPDGNGEIIYPWQNPGENEPRMKLSKYKRYEDLNWFINAGLYLDELYTESSIIRKDIFWFTAAAMFIVLLTTLFVVLHLKKVDRDNQLLEENLRIRNKEIEDQREHLIEAEKMNSLGQIVAGVAHEINTPLGASISAASYLDKINQETRLKLSQGRLTKADLKQLISTIDDSMEIMNLNLERSANLVRSFKKIAVDQSDEVLESFEVKQYIDAILLSLKHEYKNRNIKFFVTCPDELSLVSYPGAFSQVLTNLVMNSLIHGFRDRTEGIVTINCHIKRQQLIIHYSDNGHGIEPELIGHIFKPFFTTIRGEGGSGLGLSLVYNLITNQMSGKIVRTSIKESGTTFDIVLPLDIRLLEKEAEDE